MKTFCFFANVYWKRFETEVIERNLDNSATGFCKGEIQNSVICLIGKKQACQINWLWNGYIFGWDGKILHWIYARATASKLFITKIFLDGEKLADGEILAAEFTIVAKPFRAIKFSPII